MAAVTVSVRELKQRLSYYLRLVQQGESVVVTWRGVPVGRLEPAGQSLSQRLSQMQQAGQVAWSGKPFTPDYPVAVHRTGKTVAQLLVEDRR